MWWPAIGGVVVGIGGLIDPRALGVGYDVIGELLQGRMTAGSGVREARAIGSTLALVQIASPDTVTAAPDELLRTVVQRMATTGRTTLPVVEPGTRRLLGMIAQCKFLSSAISACAAR
jgi:CIC family chloride channel protein